jgi:hypothetical protein
MKMSLSADEKMIRNSVLKYEDHSRVMRYNQGLKIRQRISEESSIMIKGIGFEYEKLDQMFNVYGGANMVNQWSPELGYTTRNPIKQVRPQLKHEVTGSDH